MYVLSLQRRATIVVAILQRFIDLLPHPTSIIALTFRLLHTKLLVLLSPCTIHLQTHERHLLPVFCPPAFRLVVASRQLELPRLLLDLTRKSSQVAVVRRHDVWGAVAIGSSLGLGHVLDREDRL